jgi:lipoprotein-anchoring transpeptidase ErfK/SrfK
MMKKLLLIPIIILSIPIALFSFEDSAEVLILDGKNIEENDPKAALEFYTQALPKASDNLQLKAEVFYHIGRVKHRLNMLLSSQEHLRQAIQLGEGLPFVESARNRLWDVNTEILFSRIETPYKQTVTVRPGDTLGRIANANHTTIEYIKRANRLSSDIIHPGMTLVVPKQKFSVVINISNNTLTLKAGDEIIKVYRVATGTKETPTPEGNFTVTEKVVNPVWYRRARPDRPGRPARPRAIIPAGSPDNLLGTRWVGISKAGYGIHGTIDPLGIGRRITDGCIRLTNKDVEELFVLLVPGSEVIITR